MPCFDLRPAVQSVRVNVDTGKQSYIFLPRHARVDPSVEVFMMPCKQCIGCRLRKSAEWASRCIHEASLFDNNCFITLTYSPEYLPSNGSLVKDDFQLFMKRLRKKFSGIDPVLVPVLDNPYGMWTYPIRYYHCGEYGDRYSRPHYHAILFNFNFPDLRFWKKTPAGGLLYTSRSLQKLWKFGYSSVGTVTFDSAAYVARYSLKKINGLRKRDHYRRFDVVTGDEYYLDQEYSTMSRRPGIARRWIERFKDDVYPHDYVVLPDGSKMQPPSYYDSFYELEDLDGYADMKLDRKIKALRNKALDDFDPRRILVKETVAKSKSLLFNRNVE